MASIAELLRAGRHDEVWQMYCGFLDMTLDDFMAVQERLLLEQLDMVNNSPWGRSSSTEPSLPRWRSFVALRP